MRGHNLSNVTPLVVKPKTATRQYRRHQITITFEPTTKKWSWTFVHTASVPFSGSESTMDAALRAAKREVDRIEDGTL